MEGYFDVLTRLKLETIETQGRISSQCTNPTLILFFQRQGNSYYYELVFFVLFYGNLIILLIYNS